MALHTLTGVVSPIGAVTPDYLGQHYVDTNTSTIYQAYGTANTDWSANMTAANIRRIVDDKSGAYTIVAGDLGKVINVDATAGAVTLTLTAAATMADGFWCYVRKADSSGNAVTIDPNAAETINGGANISVTAQFEMRLLVCDGTTWFMETDASSGGSSVSFAGLIDNAEISITRSGNAETFHLKTAAGSDPSGSDIVKVGFANATGGFDIVQCTSALSFTFSSGSTGGAVNALEFKVGIILLNNAGTLALGAVVRPSGIKDNSIVSTTAEGGAGAADSPRVIYSASALTNVRARVLGYATYTLAAVGTWDTAPSDVLLTCAGAMEVQVKELLYESVLTAAGVFDTITQWPGGLPSSEYTAFAMEGLLRSGVTATSDTGHIYLNGDNTVTNYHRQFGGAGNGTAFAGETSAPMFATITGNTSPTGAFAVISGDIASPGSSTVNKMVRHVVGVYRDTGNIEAVISSVTRTTAAATDAITKIQYSPDGWDWGTSTGDQFVSGSSLKIFGLKTMTVLM